MKSYNSIPYWNKGKFGEQCICFNKIDGSQIRAEWSKKSGWYKFGSRNVLLDPNDPILGGAINIFREKYAESLTNTFITKYKGINNFVVFLEFFGKNSFAGQHDPNDTKDIVLFDVNPYKKGIINPFEFINNFGHLDIPDIIYEGEYTDNLVEKIINSDLDEGVVCKGNNWMSKIKSKKWLNKLKIHKGESELLKELNNDINLLNEL